MPAATPCFFGDAVPAGDATPILHDQRDRVVKRLIDCGIAGVHKTGVKAGLRGQAPSDHPRIATFLVRYGIGFMSVGRDGFIAVKRRVSAVEK